MSDIDTALSEAAADTHRRIGEVPQRPASEVGRRRGRRATAMAVSFLLILALGVSGIALFSRPAASEGDGLSLGEARTYYEALELSSPSEAAATFGDAFGRNDFMTVWLVLDRSAQNEWQQDFNLLRYFQIIDIDAFPDLRASLQTEVLTIDTWESFDMWYLFDRMMLLADRHDAFLIDLSGEMTVTDETVEEDHTDVSATVVGIDGVVTFRMAQAPSGRWRVVQVIVPGGDEESIPWSTPGANP